MLMRRFISLLLLLLLFFSCEVRTRQITSDEEHELISSIRQMLHNYYADIKSHGLNAEFNYLDNSSDFFWVPPGYSTAISYDSVAKILKQNAPLYRSVDNAIDTLRIIPLDKQLAIYTATLRSTITDTTGVVTILSLVETGVLIKRNDGWKLLSGQTSVVEK
jgi:hypothetical protein